MSKSNTKITTSFKLWNSAAITAQQDQIAKTGVKMLEMIRENMLQCAAHFQQHGDITLAERLLVSLPRGMIVAGVAEWFKQVAPVKFDEKGKATVTGDHKSTDMGKAETLDWTDNAEVKKRATKPITKPTIAFFKQRIQGFIKQVDRYNEQAPANEKMTDDEAKLVKLFLASVSEFANKVTLLPQKEAVKAADSQGQSRAGVRAAKQKAKDDLASQTQVAA